ncbi:MAG: 23S rRNA G2069 N7-methylase RlmK/C1962 C5-methylase RlmI [Myxococcota bacterium]|jgi:23S rRNA G2069 N7-methylase RlmK/C1962 C5-methylase RlmI
MGNLAEQASMFENRLRKNQRHVGKRARRAGVTCYRVYDRDIPELPFAVDWYEGRLHVAEYARRGSPEGDAHAEWLEALMGGAARALDVSSEDVYLKVRQRQRGTAQYQRFDRAGAQYEVSEGGHRFVVNLSDYLDTGLFLDHRATRAMVQAEAGGRRFLNLFAYTGAFSVYAAAGGAASTTTVDLSNTYCDWAKGNLRLNGFDGPAHPVIRSGVREWITQVEGQMFDLVVVDPPTFSNSKQTHQVWDVQRDHEALLDAVRRITAPGGVIYFSSNFRKLKMAVEAPEITHKTLPFDYRDKKIHRCWRLELPR